MIRALLFLILLVANSPAVLGAEQGYEVIDTPHNLAVSGGGGAHDVKSTVERRICIFCHTPHHATSDLPLWSRDASTINIYVPYTSSTLTSSPEYPRGGTRLCLSCHDGTIALGLLAGGYELDPGLSVMPTDLDPQKNPSLGTDLSDDHPVSLVYPAGLNPELHDPATLETKGIFLEEGIYVECTSCHDPHNNEFGNFLVKDQSVDHDALCLDCHNKDGWSDPDSTHRTGGIRFPDVTAQVAADGCQSCHITHNAQRGQQLLKLSAAGAGEETNCTLSCHREAPYTDVWSDFNVRTYTHPVQEAFDVHQPKEALPVDGSERHVECVDCHNPHQSGWQGGPLGEENPEVAPASSAPDVNGPLRGVRGVDESGSGPVDPARYEFEICFKCHAGNSADQFVDFDLIGLRPERAFAAFDQSQRFSSGNPSFHPVTADRLGNGQSLRTEYQASMIRIYCNDCHHPHGSDVPHILREGNTDTYPSPIADYPLCFLCHDPDYLLNPLSSPQSSTLGLHKSHVVDHADPVPCATCHDPHGVPADRGATSGNAAHLVNFDTRYAGASPVFDAVGRSCTVDCHTTGSPDSKTHSY